jgi:hypothetical protein
MILNVELFTRRRNIALYTLSIYILKEIPVQFSSRLSTGYVAVGNYYF